MAPDERDLLIATIGNYAGLKPASLALMLDHCSVRTLPKEAHLSRIGKPDSMEYFLLEGVLHRYVDNELGDPVSTGFYLGKMVLTPHFARTIAGKSIFNVQALTAFVLAEMPVKVRDSLRYSYQDIQGFGLKVDEQELLTSLSGDMAHRSLGAKDRLLAFRDKYPNLENLIPHSIIASYLGITPVSFSRLRKELAGK
ncbi:MAG: Crp/Fnr family transcriptional regulator [Saprospiraceae bacterium]|nr:Crp/Fnr family transcriptional regulator [Saprospiraceae bacterium]